MRAVLLAALVGRLPLGSWQVNASVCRPTKGAGNSWRLAGTQAEGLHAATAFEALAHAVIGDKDVTLCKVKLLEGKSDNKNHSSTQPLILNHMKKHWSCWNKGTSICSDSLMLLRSRYRSVNLF